MSADVCGYIEVDGVKYWKPNMAALDGDLAREIAYEIMHAPKYDYEKHAAEVAEINARIRKAKEDGTF